MSRDTLGEDRQHQASGGREHWSVRRFGRMVVTATKDLVHDSGPQWAAAIAYYSLLSAFPLLLVITSIAAFFVDPRWAVDQATRLLGNFLPQGENRIEQIIQSAIDARRNVGILSFATLLWTGTRVFSSITKALNIAYDTNESYGFFRRLLVEVVMLLTLGLFFIIAIASPFVLGVLWNMLQFLPGGEGIIFQIIRRAVPAILLAITFFLIYRFVPRRRPDWRAALIGAIVATGIFLLAQPLFVYYLQQFANYNLIYGSVAIIVILIFWAWIVALIMLYGGEITSHTQAILIEGMPEEQVEQHHKARRPTHRPEEHVVSEQRQASPAGAGRERSYGERRPAD